MNRIHRFHTCTSVDKIHGYGSSHYNQVLHNKIPDPRYWLIYDIATSPQLSPLHLELLYENLSTYIILIH